MNHYLRYNELKEGMEIIHKGEAMELIERDGLPTTLINEDDGVSDIDYNSNVFIRQRWKVEILPKTLFDKRFVTHRFIESYYSTYSEYIREQSKIFKTNETHLDNEKDDVDDTIIF